MFFNRKKDDIRVIDIHSHILPGIDDGAENIDVSVDMARTAYENGVTDIIVTPHKKEYLECADKETITYLIKELEIKLIIYEIPVRLYPGNEIMRSSNFEFNDNDFCTLNNTNYLLVEFEPNDQFSKIYGYLDNLVRGGYNVVLAHAERYYCLLENIKNVEKITDMDILIQVNYHSVINNKNKDVYKFVHKLLKKQFVDFVASDAHDTELRSYEIDEAVSYLYRHFDHEYVDSIVYKNAIKYLGVADGNK